MNLLSRMSNFNYIGNSSGDCTCKSEDKSIHLPVGLQNLHNTCYFNSILQCLIQIQPLTSYFLSTNKYQWEKEAIFSKRKIGQKQKQKQQHGGKNDKNGNGHEDDDLLISSYVTFLQTIMSSQQSSQTKFKAGNYNGNDKNINAISATATSIATVTVTPLQLLNAVKKCIPLFNNHSQHDPHEFCFFFINALHEHLNRRFHYNGSNHFILDNPITTATTGTTRNARTTNHNQHYTNMSIDFWKQHLQQNDSIIVDHMQGLLQNNIYCPRCSFSSVTFDVYSNLSLPIPSSPTTRTSTTSIQDCLKEFGRSNTLDDSNMWHCENCKLRVNAKQSVRLWTIPNILIFHLKRFHTTTASTRSSSSSSSRMETKNHQHISFPIDTLLNMKPFVHGPTSSGSNENSDDSMFQYKVSTVQYGTVWYGVFACMQRKSYSSNLLHFQVTTLNNPQCKTPLFSFFQSYSEFATTKDNPSTAVTIHP